MLQGGRRAAPPKIAGVQILELGNVLTRSGWMTELFRKDWDGVKIAPQQINWVELSPNGVTDWHRHASQTDHLIGVGGVIKLALWDERAASPTPSGDRRHPHGRPASRDGDCSARRLARPA